MKGLKILERMVFGFLLVVAALIVMVADKRQFAPTQDELSLLYPDKR
jgi:hypothetical protein